MTPRTIEIDGKRYVWHDILELRRQQLKEHRAAGQPALFELTNDRRPASQRMAAGRYRERCCSIPEIRSPAMSPCAARALVLSRG